MSLQSRWIVLPGLRPPRENPFMLRNSILLLMPLLGLAALPPAARTQTRAPAAEAPLAARMQAFLDALNEGDLAPVAAFFPRRGEWARVRTWGGRSRGERTETARFAAAETPRAIAAGGAACESFAQPAGEYGPVEGALAMQAMMNRSGWRRVRGNRFVPPGEDARSPVFVEWRREDGRWVVSAYGEEYPDFPRLLGTPVSMISRDTLIAAEGAAYAADAPWFVQNTPITFEGWRYVRYGLPRRFEPGALARLGSLGRIAVYARAGDTRAPEVLMVPVRPGELQVYQGFRPTGSVCR
ncbi:MAG TPA: hypothetical protein VF006_28250 [Longimicrobium sp.]